MFSLVWGLFIRLIPDKLFACIKMDEAELTGSRKNTLLASVRRTPPSAPSIDKEWKGTSKPK